MSSDKANGIPGHTVVDIHKWPSLRRLPRVSHAGFCFGNDAAVAHTLVCCRAMPLLLTVSSMVMVKASVVWGKLTGRSPGLGLRRGDLVVFKPPEDSRYRPIFERARALLVVVYWLQKCAGCRAGEIVSCTAIRL